MPLLSLPQEYSLIFAVFLLEYGSEKISENFGI
jgi:hypothetical protein